MRKLKLLAAMLALMAAMMMANVSPASADDWDGWNHHDSWRDCGWVPVWEWSWVFERWDLDWEFVPCVFFNDFDHRDRDDCCDNDHWWWHHRDNDWWDKDRRDWWDRDRRD